MNVLQVSLNTSRMVCTNSHTILKHGVVVQREREREKIIPGSGRAHDGSIKRPRTRMRWQELGGERDRIEEERERKEREGDKGYKISRKGKGHDGSPWRGGGSNCTVQSAATLPHAGGPAL